ncbi:MAG: hypothetical protein QNJ47_18650 [Nostocaceae cyanobacterium]|nr:hypothetical protein [Nostocaceae cyanobacterium]
MNILINFLRSLLFTIIFSFVTPMFFIGCLLLGIFLFGYIPPLQGVTEAISTPIFQFLSIFGNGIPLRGVVVISLTCSFVGGLFDTYAYYRCQILRIGS